MTGAGLRPLRAAVAEWKPGRSIASDPLHEIASAWASIVGADVAAHCSPLELAGKTLLVATKSSAWSQQLSFLAGTIVAGVRALPGGPGIERLSFRVAPLRSRAVPNVAGKAAARRQRRSNPEPAVEPALDLQGAFERLRERIRSSRPSASAGGVCAGCGAALEAAERKADAAMGERRCAPCVGRHALENAVALERLIYMAPWLTLAELRDQLPWLSGSEFEHARRRLLQRWWLLLERTRRSGRVSRSGVERQVASSYVLLQSRLPPDRLSAAVVRNLLGDELDALLWPRSDASRVGQTGAFVE